jgi:hypothetical protein
MFTRHFDRFACAGDTITAEHDGFTLTARIHLDDCGDKPDQRMDGFWPSLNPQSAGFIGEGKTAKQLTAAKRRASAIMNAWQRGEWFYCGIAVTVSRAGVDLTAEFSNALWGIECNYPGTKNQYLRDVANELADEAILTAQQKLSELCAA